MTPAQAKLQIQKMLFYACIIEESVIFQGKFEIVPSEYAGARRPAAWRNNSRGNFHGAADHRHFRLDDAALFARDGDIVRTEIRLVILGDRRDRRDDRRDHVGGVETAAQTDFDDRHFGAAYGQNK